MTAIVKLIPLVLAWGGIVTALARYFPGRRVLLLLCCSGSFSAAVLLCTLFKGDIVAGTVKSLAGAGFICLLVAALALFYRATGSGARIISARDKNSSAAVMSGAALLTGLLAGAISFFRLAPGWDAPLIHQLLLVSAGIVLSVAAVLLERSVPAAVTLTAESLLALIVSLLLFALSFSLQLDLFSPLSMKVMKFIHDFVHQFFESMLVPDHLFFRRDAWDYIGYLFSSGVGFWGGLFIWFAPAALIGAAFRLERLPSVAHIRQGAKRRKLLAACIRGRRCRLIAPWAASVILALAVYNSRFPAVEYWDPKPLEVTVNSSGELLIPKKGEINLEDGKLHKYVLRQGGREARFMVLQTPDGQLTVTLDACAICKPDGYGQAEGALVCYYCKTLIPLDTVGKPGGCNPVPLPFKVVAAGVSIDAMTLLNRWKETVTAGSRIEGGGR